MSLMKNSMIATAAIFACRITGMIREMVYMALFGDKGVLDAFYTAFRIPNLLRDLFAEGALSQSYTSVATKTKSTEGDEATWELTQKIATQLSSLMLVIITLGICFAGPIMQLLYGSDLGEPQHSDYDFMGLAVGLNQIMWPFIGFASLSALIMGALNMFGKFGLPMLASAAFNITSVLIGLGLGYYMDPNFGPQALYGFAIGVTLGGIAQMAVQLPALRKTGFRWKLNFHWKGAEVRRIWALMIPSVVASGVTQFNVFINTGFALDLQEGSVVALTGAFRIWQLPVGLFGVATGMVVLPTIAKLIAEKKQSTIAEQVAGAMKLVAFFAIPSVVVLGVLGTEIISLAYQRGQFNENASAYMGQVLSAYSIGLIGYAGTKVVQPVLLALEKKWVPLIVAAISLSISLSLNYYFVYVLHKDASWLALTTSVVTTFTFLFYFFYLRNHLGSIGGKDLCISLTKVVVASLGMAVIYYFGKLWFMQDFVYQGFFYRLFLFGSVVTVGGIVYLGLSWIFKTPELMMAVDKVLKRARR